MNDIIEARAWVFGDSVDTDNMYPGFAMKLSIEEAAKQIFYSLRPGWTDEVRPGDIVVAGRNFGVGSSRPVAQLFRHLGVAALVADEFNSLFMRNSVNFGLPALTIPGVTDLVRDQDDVIVNIREATIKRRDEEKVLTGIPLPGFVLDIIAHGGLMAKLMADGYITADPNAISRSRAGSEDATPVV